MLSASPQNFELLPSDFKSVIQSIDGLFEAKMTIDQWDYRDDKDWINFHIPGWVDNAVFIKLQQERDNIFGNEMWSYQVLCPKNLSSGNGLWLHYLRNLQTSAEFAWGFYYF